MSRLRFHRPLELAAGGENVAAARRSYSPRAVVPTQREMTYGTLTLIDVFTAALLFMSVAVMV